MKPKTKSYLFFIILLGFITISFGIVSKPQHKVTAILKTSKTTFTTGSEIQLNFNISEKTNTSLFLNTSYGSAFLSSKDGTYTIPKFITEKKGVVSYNLLHKKQEIFSGNFYIAADTSSTTQLESYIGPPSILVGGTDYTMPVIIPKDIYDNPLPDSTLVTLNHQFLNNQKQETLYTHDMIVWKNLYSYQKSGRILISSQSGNTTSKEFVVDMFPSLPEDFQISFERKHEYADGNQITIFKTSVLKDIYGNIISNGTSVVFNIITQNGMLLRTEGSSLDGIVKSFMLHPNHKETWKVQAFIKGIAKSNQIQLEYKEVLKDYTIQFTQDNRKITIGPILSFMGQIIPDGAMSVLTITDEKEHVQKKINYSKDGIIAFVLDQAKFNNGIYNIKVEVMGVTKSFQQITLK